jgi:hypothetical protein
MKRKQNGVLVEYARKRDSCSFLISNLILEEHMNEFFIYSSNKFGNNKDKGTKLLIENRDMLHKHSGNIQSTFYSFSNNKQLMILACLAAFLIFLFFLICCLLMRCQNQSHNSSASSSSSMLSQANGKLATGRVVAADNLKSSNQNLAFFENSIYKYNQNQYSAGSLVNTGYTKSANSAMYKKKANYEGKPL